MKKQEKVRLNSRTPYDLRHFSIVISAVIKNGNDLGRSHSMRMTSVIAIVSSDKTAVAIAMAKFVRQLEKLNLCRRSPLRSLLTRSPYGDDDH